MNKFHIITLKALRKLYAKTVIGQLPPYDRGITDPNKASSLIYDLLASGRPCMIARFGSVELIAMVNYLGVSAEKHSAWKYIKGEQPQWWWNEMSVSQLQTNAGVFPITDELAARFAQRMLEDMKQVDILGSWQRQEQIMIEHYGLNLQKVSLLTLEPYWAEEPWSRILKGKKVLVVHPFAPLIEKQYKEHRKQLFPCREVLPEFELKTIQAVQSIGGACEYKDWFEALDTMKAQMDATDYDIALIGCGAYGFPLAAHVPSEWASKRYILVAHCNCYSV